MRSPRSLFVPLVVAVTWPASGGAAPARCEPVATVSGPAKVVAPVVKQLRQLGVRASSARACRQAVEARLQVAGERIAIRLRVAAGDQVSLVASNPRTAAAFIESYARPDLGDPLLRPTAELRRTASAEPVSAVAPASAAFIAPRPAPAAVTEQVDAPVMRGRAVSVAVTTDVAYTDDASLWQSIGLTITVPVRGLRVGGGARYAQSERHSYRDDLLSVDRNAKELFAVATLPRRWGRVSAEPSVRAGLSWLFTERYEPPAEERWSDVYCMVPGASDPLVCDPGAPLYVGDGFALADVNLLVGARIDGAVSIGRGFSLAFGGGVDWLPTGGGDGRLPPYVQRELELDPSFPAQYFELAAEPSLFWRVGVGVRASLP